MLTDWFDVLVNDRFVLRLCENSRRVKCGFKISKKPEVEWPAWRYWLKK